MARPSKTLVIGLVALIVAVGAGYILLRVPAVREPVLGDEVETDTKNEKMLLITDFGEGAGCPCHPAGRRLC